MTKKEVVREIGRPFLKWTGLAQAIFVCALVFNFFLWIWLPWVIIYKIWLSAIIGILSCYLLDKLIVYLITEILEDEIKIYNTG